MFKSKKGVVCPICSDLIEDAIGRKRGHGAIFCDGVCQEWFHCQCAGLSKTSLEAASVSNLPFLQQSSELAEVKATLEELT